MTSENHVIFGLLGCQGLEESGWLQFAGSKAAAAAHGGALTAQGQVPASLKGHPPPISFLPILRGLLLHGAHPVLTCEAPTMAGFLAHTVPHTPQPCVLWPVDTQGSQAAPGLILGSSLEGSK